MLRSSFPGSVSSSGPSRVKAGSGPNSVPQTFKPFGRYAEVGSQKIKSTRPGIRLHVGSASTLFLSKGTLLGKDITYISQVWNAWDSESMQMFYEQVLPYIRPEGLRPLMGVCVPTVIGIHSTAGGVSLAMELPHPIGWRPADPYISAELKEKIITAYQNLHRRNILHNDLKLENILIGDDDKVTIVDFCKMVVDPVPADLALEIRAVKFMLDYDGAKELEYERLRRAESQEGKDFRRSWIRRAAESLGLSNEAECDVLPSQDDVYSPPFSRQSLMKWDSEVVTEGTTNCPGWRGERFEVPEDMRSPQWLGTEAQTPPTTPPHQPTDFPGTLDPSPVKLHYQWTDNCHYFSSLWSSRPEFTASGRRKSIGTPSSSSTPPDLSDRATISERSSTTGSEPSERDPPDSPLFTRKRLRAGDPTHWDNRSPGSEPTHRSKSSESFARYEEDQTSWVIRRTERFCRPSPGLKGKERLVTSSWEPSPLELGLPNLADRPPSPRKSSAGSKGSTTGSSWKRASALVDPRRSSPSTSRTRMAASLKSYYPRPNSEKKCSVVVMDSDEEDKVWFMSKETLQDVKGYLRVKKATGGATEMRLGGEALGTQHPRQRVEKVLRTPSTRPTRKRVNTLEDDDGVQGSKRRRSWPEIK